MSDHVRATVVELRLEAHKMLDVAEQLERWNPPAVQVNKVMEPVPTPAAGPLAVYGPVAAPEITREDRIKRMVTTFADKQNKATAKSIKGKVNRQKEKPGRGVRPGRVNVTGLVHRLAMTATRAFAVREMLDWCKEQGAKQANVGSVGFGLRTAVKNGVLVVVKKGVYGPKANPKSEIRNPKTGNSQAEYRDPEERMRVLHLRVGEAVREQFPIKGKFTREEMLGWIKSHYDQALAEALEDGELGGVLRALQAEGKIKLAVPPGPGQPAVYERVG